MRKTLTAFVAATALAGASLAAPTAADARNGGAVAAGVIGGLAAGALIGGAVATRPAYGYYDGGYNGGYYAPRAYYAEPAPVYYGNNCWRRERFWDGYGYRVRRVNVC